MHKVQGFTLAELLISLTILGVIATFTIPKILNSASNGQNTAIAKEAASMVAGAMSSFQLNNTLSSATTGGDLTQYMNYVGQDTATAVSFTCSATLPCLRLHNGGYMQYATGNFAGSASTNALNFDLDPDGAGSQTSVTFVQFYNGRLTTYAQAVAGASTPTVGANNPANVATDPSYIQSWN